jgi:ankyrin repeat protein
VNFTSPYSQTQQSLLRPSLTCKNYPELFTAIRSDDLATFQRLVSQLPNFSIRLVLPYRNFDWIFEGRPYLIQICALYASLQCFVFLLDSGCPHDVKDDTQRHLLHFVFAGGSRDILNHLHQLDSTLNLTVCDRDSLYPIHFAAKFGRLALLQWLDAHNYPLNEVSLSNLATPLMWACQEGHLDCVRFLLARGAKATESTRGGWTPLHYAVGRDHAAVAQCLLSDPAVDPDARTGQGLTPLQQAFKKNAADCCALLVDRGCRLCPAGEPAQFDEEEDVDDDRRHIVVVAAARGKKKVLGALLHKKGVMASFGRAEFVQFFRDCLGEVSNETVEALCAALRAKGENDEWPVEQALIELIEKGFAAKAIGAVASLGTVRTDAVDGLGRSWLHLAAQSNNSHVMQCLLDWGVNPRVTDLEGKTALDWAREKQNLVAVALLERRTGKPPPSGGVKPS